MKLKGPCLAQSASGTVGDQLIFSNWKGRPYLKFHAMPKQPRTPPQVAMRAVLAWLSQEWRKLFPGQQKMWEPLAAQTDIPPFNAFQAFNLARWRDGHGTTMIPQTDTAGLFGSFGNTIVTPVTRGVHFSNTVTAVEELWYLAIHHVPGSGDPYTWGRLIHVLYARAIATHTWTWRPVAPGTYYFAITVGKIHGQLWPGQQSRSAIVT